MPQCAGFGDVAVRFPLAPKHKLVPDRIVICIKEFRCGFHSRQGVIQKIASRLPLVDPASAFGCRNAHNGNACLWVIGIGKGRYHRACFHIAVVNAGLAVLNAAKRLGYGTEPVGGGHGTVLIPCALYKAGNPFAVLFCHNTATGHVGLSHKQEQINCFVLVFHNGLFINDLSLLICSRLVICFSETVYT